MQASLRTAIIAWLAGSAVLAGRGAPLHDIGVDVRGLAGSVEAAAVVRALEEFGYFSDDDQTEFLPYWRTADILRYGEEFEVKDGFTVEAEDPTARTRVSAFIRPDGAKRKALFVIVNEGTNEVRGQLYVQQPTYIFGGFNALFVEDICSQLDFSRIPLDSDWSRNRVQNTVPSLISQNTGVNKRKGINPAEVVPPLMDLESGGYVRLVERGDPTKKFGPAYKVKEFFEVYGPVYVPARGMRLLYGCGSEGSLSAASPGESSGMTAPGNRAGPLRCRSSRGASRSPKHRSRTRVAAWQTGLRRTGTDGFGVRSAQARIPSPPKSTERCIPSAAPRTRTATPPGPPSGSKEEDGPSAGCARRNPERSISSYLKSSVQVSRVRVLHIGSKRRG